MARAFGLLSSIPVFGAVITTVPVSQASAHPEQS
jgi:hypothetical protein